MFSLKSAAASAQLVVIADSLAQPGALLFKQLLADAVESAAKICLLTLEAPPDRYCASSEQLLALDGFSASTLYSKAELNPNQVDVRNYELLLARLQQTDCSVLFIDSVSLLAARHSADRICVLLRKLMHSQRRAFIFLGTVLQ